MQMRRVFNECHRSAQTYEVIKYLHKPIKQLYINLDSLCKWFKSNKLSLNTEKTFYVIFHRAILKVTNDINFNLIMDIITLTMVNSIKLLGVVVDNKLNWIDHITHVKYIFFK